VVIAGFEPLDVMQAMLMLVRQVNEGRAEVENEFTRAVTRDGNLRRAGRGGRGLRAARRFEWRGLGEVPYSALKIRPAFAPSTPSAASACLPGRARPQAVRVRRHPARREAAHRLQALRHRVHAREPDGQLHGVVRRRLRGALQLRAFRDIPIPRHS
jgi:hypothetical protein